MPHYAFTTARSKSAVQIEVELQPLHILEDGAFAQGQTTQLSNFGSILFRNGCYEWQQVCSALHAPMATVVWVQLVMTCLRGWTSESVAMRQDLIGYRL